MCQQLLDNKFQCPICGSSVYPLKSVGSPFPILSELQVIGAGPRLQKCHGCNSSDRDRLVYLYLRDIEKIFSKEHASVSVLHVAPENCIAEKFWVNSQISYTAIDSFEHGYDHPECIEKMDLLDLKLEDHTIDIVLCNHVLQDISDDISALKKIYRVLVPGGIAILQVPISPVIDSIMEHKGYLSEEECIKRYGQRFHKRIYNVEGYIDRLKSIGFKVEEVKISKHYPIESVNPNEILFIANK
ncbi:class I SAM-dependent methyltransferase [Tannerella forsythia]|uniref:Class I SAM-dependent methyltransferase n=1 Tax=Tannerella forsythia TaxID=28112 RepID=A0A3P1XHT3_TANFO|nr:class I SAM-dependent methyltransferase [Tannerella forsythia]RRD57550.1 class I SAM-dependent methyltransferase [Tannerella forsythia]